MIEWQRPDQDYTDISYETADGIAKITINRPQVRNAFRPATLFELSHAFNVARDDPQIGVIIHVPVVAADLLVAARAERLGARPGQDDHPDLRVVPGHVECV